MSLTIATPKFVATGFGYGKTAANIPKGYFTKAVSAAKSKPALVQAGTEFLAGAAEVFIVAYALDSITYVMNRKGALDERDRRLEAFLEAVRDKNLSPLEMELLAKTVPTLRRPDKTETFKALVKRHGNRAVRMGKATGWSYYTVYSSVAIIPVSAVAWGQYLGTKVVNTVVSNRHTSPKAQFKGTEREVHALLRRRRMHSWIWKNTVRRGWRNTGRQFTPFITEFYKELPEIENGAIVYINPLTGISRKVSFAPTPQAAKKAQSILERGETEPFTTEALNDNPFTEAQKITFDSDVKQPLQKQVDAAEQTAREVAIDLLAKAEDVQETVETIENWQLILEGADGYTKVGYDRCQLAYDKVVKELPEGIEQDDPRRLGAALATQVKQTKRGQLNQARKALPFWVLANLNDIDPTKLDDEDDMAAFIDFTDANGLLILQGWDDVAAKNFATV